MMEARLEASGLSLPPGKGAATASCGDVVVQVVRHANLADWQIVLKHLQKVSASSPGWVVLLALITPNAQAPRAADREQIQADLRSLGPRLRKILSVAMGSSLRMSRLRTILRSMVLLGGQAKQHVVVATIREELDCVRQVAGETTPPGSELLATINALSDTIGMPRLEVA
jgi:hypothetical protein